MKDIRAGSATSSVASLTAVNGVLYFAANDGTHGTELWRSDGTSGGTYLVSDINAGGSSGSPRFFAAINGFLYFSADNGAGLLEPWRSDGTAAGTVQVGDIEPGAAVVASPSGYAGLNGNVYFSATDGVVGRELWKADAPVVASTTSGVLTIQGTANNDAIAVSASGQNYLVNMNGISTLIPQSVVSAFNIVGGIGNDILDVDGTTYTFTSDLGAATANLTLEIEVQAIVHFGSSQHLAGLNVLGTATVDAGGDKTIVAKSLQVTGGSLDMHNNALIVDYDPNGQSPLGSSNGSSYSGITGLIQSGRNGGAWIGSGIVTSMTTAQGSTAVTTLGVAEASQVANFLNGATTAVWNGQTVDATAVLVKYTYAGDVDLNGRIDGDDYFWIDLGYEAHANGWGSGDLNYDARVDADDYFLIDRDIRRAQVTPLSQGAEVREASPVLADGNASAYRRLIEDGGEGEAVTQ